MFQLWKICQSLLISSIRSSYAKNYETIKSVVESFDPDDAVAISESQTLLNSKKLKKDLLYIWANFECIAVKITQLESRNLSLKNSLELVQDVVKGIEDSNCQPAIKKLNDVLNNNKGYGIIVRINNLLNGEKGENLDDLSIDIADIINFKAAPIVSVEVERVFSEYKSILSDNRQIFLFPQLKNHVIIKCNHFL